MTQTTQSADPGATPPPANPGNDNWFSTLPAEQIGYLQNKGWADPDPKVTATKLLEGYQGFEKFHGLPKERIIARPVDGDAAGWKTFWEGLGAPADAKDYSFDGISFGDDDDSKALTAKFTDKLRTTAAALNIPKDMAAALAKSAFDYIAEHGTAEEARAAAQQQADRQALEKDWGTPETDRFKGNMLIANRGAEKMAAELGLSGEDIAKFRDAIGSNPVVAKMFNWIGRATGEARYISGENNDTGMMTREQAIAERFRLTGIDSNGHATGKGDPAFVKKVMSKTEGANERKQIQDLNRIIVGAV